MGEGGGKACPQTTLEACVPVILRMVTAWLDHHQVASAGPVLPSPSIMHAMPL